MLNIDKDDIESYSQGDAYAAPARNALKKIEGLLAEQFLNSSEKPYLKRLAPEDALAFFDGHTQTRLRLPEEQRQFMKELRPEVLSLLMAKNMPVIGVFVGDRIVSGCAILYTSDKDIADYLPGYDFGGMEDKTAVISAVWTDPEHVGKGYSKKAVEIGMDIAVIDGKEIFRAKVDKKNAPSLAIFGGFDFDTKIEGQDSRKVYPLLAL
ncbi:MAG TPA: GNAT family N-acetyltransferase [Micavibrio sp.]|nr:GNAT family N-acetyltransferase [Micavibrio sp.]